jgi:CheY-like chemotaxis protein
MQLTLGKLGIKGLGSLIDRAYNGLEGVKKVLESFESESHIYGLIITDISMPVMDGYDASQKIREFYRLKSVPQPLIVACTGHVEEEFIKKAWINDIDEVLPKPVNVEIISEILKDIIEEPNE